MNVLHPAPLGFLAEIDQAIRRILANADFAEGFPYIFGHPDDFGPEIVVRSSNGVLLHKARLHLVAILRAYEKANLHSMAVHTRVAMECAAQVVSEAWAVHEGPPKGLERLLNAREYDFQRAMLSSSRGQIDNRLISQMITSAREGIGQFDWQTAKDSYNNRQGFIPASWQGWYKFLSDNFCHPNLDVLSGPSHMGGVTARDARTNGAILRVSEAAARWLLDMLLANGFITIGAGGGNQLFDEAIELRRRWDALSESPSPTGEIEFGYISVESDENHVGEDDWSAACQWSMQALLELMKIHLAIDPPQRQLLESERACVLQLRKVQFHVRTVILWPITPEAVHVIAPEIRAAREQLNKIIRDSGMLCGSMAAHTKRSEQQLEPFSHPTTGTVWQSLSLGGFGKDTISWRAWLALLLMGLVVDYACCFGRHGRRVEPLGGAKTFACDREHPAPGIKFAAGCDMSRVLQPPEQLQRHVHQEIRTQCLQVERDHRTADAERGPVADHPKPAVPPPAAGCRACTSANPRTGRPTGSGSSRA